ncbi:MAG: hypothetical protein IJ104_00605 [Methanobrevibacter sp.]|nr:hypothetical protein [Methanobrevibacter sp.]MBQ9024869.1 hypothetical protein [Methanobrevibacter sp.]
MTNEENTEEITNSKQRELLIKQLAVETGLPLSPTPAKQIVPDFDDDVIIVDHYPIQSINKIMIDKKCICINDCIIDEESGLIYLDQSYTGRLYIQYIYCIPEAAYSHIIDLMVDYENNPGWDKRAASISEGGVTVSLDTSGGQWGVINSLITSLKNQYNATARLI